MIPPANKRRPPAWLTILLLLLSLPLLAMPQVLSNLSDDQGLLMLFPLIVMLAVYLAYKSWVQRPYISLILIAVLILSYASILIILF